MTLALVGLTYFLATKRNYPMEPWPGVQILFRGFITTFPAPVTPLIIVGGILAGVITPTESGAVAVLYALSWQ